MTNGELSVFLLTYISPNTNVILIVPRQNWCRFEALECIFHLNLKKIPSVNQLTHNTTKYSVSKHMVDPVSCLSERHCTAHIELVKCQLLQFIQFWEIFALKISVLLWPMSIWVNILQCIFRRVWALRTRRKLILNGHLKMSTGSVNFRKYHNQRTVICQLIFLANQNCGLLALHSGQLFEKEGVTKLLLIDRN